MPHHLHIASSDAITPETPVGELVAARPNRSRVFDACRIDYCCGGKLPLSEACAKRGLEVAMVVDLLRACDDQAATDETAEVDADRMSLTELADHIEETHHARLREELPRLGRMVEKVTRVHGEHEPRLATVHSAFTALVDELTSHMTKEERVLFPIIRAMEREPDANSGDGACADVCGGTIADPIRQMEHEHEQAGEALRTMHEATDGYTPPEWACNTYRAMLDGLAWLERDMHRHVHKENSILFPKALALETKIAGRATS